MKRNSMLDIIKAICIVFVIVTHLAWTPEEELQYYFPLWIDMSVPLFMLITGYVYTKSFEKKQYESIGQAYTLHAILPRVIRYTLPYLVVFIAQQFILVELGQIKQPEPEQLLTYFLTGGIGPGSYYYPILIQLVFVFPAIHFVIKRHKTRGLLVCIAANVLFELLQWAYGMNQNCYRLLIFRYVMLLAFGSYFAMNGKLPIIASILLFVAGFAGGYAVSYCDWSLFFVPYWQTTSFLPSMMVVPLFYYLLRVNIRFKPVEVFGKASYDIFLVQMLLFSIGSKIYENDLSREQQFVGCILVCMICGLILYLIESPIANKLASLAGKPKKKNVETSEVSSS